MPTRRTYAKETAEALRPPNTYCSPIQRQIGRQASALMCAPETSLDIVRPRIANWEAQVGLVNMLWKRTFNTMEAELRRLGYTTHLRDDPARDSPERRAIRVVSSDVVLDLYIRNGYWTFDQWFKSEGGWLQQQR